MVGIDRNTAAAPPAARSASRSASRATSRFLVTTVTGLRNSASTCRQRRVMRSLRSTGWYGSVTPESASGRGRQRGRASSAASSSGASSLTTMRVSKSSPAEKPRYSCVGRA